LALLYTFEPQQCLYILVDYVVDDNLLTIFIDNFQLFKESLRKADNDFAKVIYGFLVSISGIFLELNEGYLFQYILLLKMP